MRSERAAANPLRWPDLARHGAGHVRRFFEAGLWDTDLARLDRPRAALYRACRIAFTTVRGLLDPTLSFRAAALTYFSVLSIVPFLAFAFAILKGFGAYQTFVDGAVRPYLRQTFSGNTALEGAMERILDFVQGTDVSRLGTAGVLFLVYTSVSLLSNVELTLNEIWEAKTKRPLVRQVTDYVTLLVIAPMLVLVATTFATAAQSSDLVLFLRESLALGSVIDFLLRFSSIAIVGLALFATYMILPNVRTRAGSALLGAAVAALLWQAALVLHVRFQVGVARYNALYSVLGAIPIFLVWTYLSWLIVLVGAQLAASHQNERSSRQRLRAQRADQAVKEVLAVAVAARVARDFLDESRRRRADELAELLEVPPPAVEDVLESLVRTGVLARAVCAGEIGYVPGRDLDVVRVTDVRDALRREPEADPIRSAVSRQLGGDLERMLRALDEERRASSRNLTLRQLAALVAPAPAAPAAPRDPSEASRPPVLDSKQPEIPS